MNREIIKPLFSSFQDSLGGSFLASTIQENGSTVPQTKLTTTSADVLSTDTIVPDSHPMNEAQYTVSDNKSTSGALKPSSVVKLQSFKFIKTSNTPTSSSILGKRAATDSRRVDNIKPSPPKMIAPSDEEILDSFLFSDFMELDFPPPNDNTSSTRKDVHSKRSGNSDEHLSTVGQQPSTVNYPTSRSVSLMNQANPRPPTNTPNSTTSLFKAPINRVKTTTTISTICSPQSKSILSTPTKTSNPSSNAIINSPSCIASNKQFSTPRNRGVRPLTQFNTPTNSVQSSQNISTSQEQISTPSNVRHDSTPQQSRTSTPSCFRTPLSRQPPTAMVCTPGGNARPPAMMKAPHSSRRRFPGPAGLLPSLVS